MHAWQGRVEKEKLDSFNLPFYAPSLDEVRDVIARSQAFDVTHFQLFDSNWDPHDDDDDDDVEMKMEEEEDAVQSGVNVAMSIRAAIGPLIARQQQRRPLPRLTIAAAAIETMR